MPALDMGIAGESLDKIKKKKGTSPGAKSSDSGEYTQIAYVKRDKATAIEQKVMESGLGYVRGSDPKRVWSQLGIGFLIAKISWAKLLRIFLLTLKLY